MQKYKSIFKKNLFLMIIVILILTIVILVITKLKENNKGLSIGGNFILTDQDGNFYDSSKNNKKKLIYFGYTFCPDVCPFDILKMSEFVESNPKVLFKVEPLFITIDPERDNPKILKSFLENFNSAIIGLTGTLEEISSLQKKFRIFVKKNKKNSSDQNYLVDHTILFFLINGKGEYISHFRPNELNLNIQKYLN